MWQHSDVHKSSRITVLVPHKPTRRCWLFVLASAILVLVSLACALTGSGSRSGRDRVVIVKRLPTFTPTTMSPAEAALTTSEPVINPTAALSAPTSSPTPLPTFTPAGASTTASTAPDGQGSDGATLTSLVVLNVRAGPGVEYPVMGRLNQGQSTQIIGQNPEGTWWQIAYPPGSNSLAWVSADPQYADAGNSAGVQIAQAPSQPTQASQEAPIAQASTVPTATTSTSADTGTPQPTQTSEVSASPTAEPTAAPITTTSGWAFAGLRTLPDDDEGGLLLHGDLINNTGTPQELALITGTFYDAQGQVIADGNTTDYWPVAAIPPGGRVPFELIVPGAQSAANFDLRVEAQPGGNTPRQDFEFVDLSPSTDDGDYCLAGRLRNPGEPLESYLAIVAILYDNQDKVINYYDDYDYAPQDLVGDQTKAFEICVDSLNQEVTRYEPRAWGL